MSENQRSATTATAKLRTVAARGAPGRDGATSRSRRARELNALNAVAEVLNRSASIGEALERTLAVVAGAIGMRSGWVWLQDERGEFVPAATYHLPPYLQDPQHMTGWHCLCLRTFIAG